MQKNLPHSLDPSSCPIALWQSGRRTSSGPLIFAVRLPTCLCTGLLSQKVGHWLNWSLQAHTRCGTDLLHNKRNLYQHRLNQLADKHKHSLPHLIVFPHPTHFNYNYNIFQRITFMCSEGGVVCVDQPPRITPRCRIQQHQRVIKMGRTQMKKPKWVTCYFVFALLVMPSWSILCDLIF